MVDLINKKPEAEKNILPNPEVIEDIAKSQETGSENSQESSGLDKAELERLRQEVLEEVDIADRPEKRPTVLPSQPTVSNASRKSQDLLRIESLLEEDLVEVYIKMTPELQAKFKLEGEKTAAKIEEIVQSGKVEARKIFKLILRWLKLIPGVNKFFLKQSAKIKTDKILTSKK